MGTNIAPKIMAPSDIWNFSAHPAVKRNDIVTCTEMLTAEAFKVMIQNCQTE